jgi:hypothetical protein
MMRALSNARMLGIVPRLRETEIDPGAIATFEDVFRRAGISVRPAPPR